MSIYIDVHIVLFNNNEKKSIYLNLNNYDVKINNIRIYSQQIVPLFRGKFVAKKIQKKKNVWNWSQV